MGIKKNFKVSRKMRFDKSKPDPEAHKPKYKFNLNDTVLH